MLGQQALDDLQLAQKLNGIRPCETVAQLQRTQHKRLVGCLVRGQSRRLVAPRQDLVRCEIELRAGASRRRGDRHQPE
jgi:hypothetical protein